MSGIETADPLSPTRRRFLIGGLGASGALLVGWGVWPQSIDRLGDAALWSPGEGGTPLNGWISIGADGQVRLAMPRLEMGQGVHTTLAMLVAEQLGVAPAQISLAEAGMDRIYANAGLPVRVLQPDAEDSVRGRLAAWLPSPGGRWVWWQITAGSSSVADAWGFLPMVAATARTRLLGAAALRWHVPLSELTVAQGVVRHVGLGLKAHYGELVQQSLRVPLGRVELLPREDWQVLGQPVPRIDLSPKVRGALHHAADVRPAGLLHAAVRMAPRPGLTPHVADEAVLRTRPGVVLVTTLPALAGAPAALAVLARTTWHAQQTLAAAQIEWRPAEGAQAEGATDAAALDSDRIAETLAAAARRACTGPAGDVLHERGQSAALGSALAASAAGEAPASGLIEALYQTPFQPHLTLEPPSCTAQVGQGQVRLWLATQVPELARAVAAEQAGVAPEAVQLQPVAAGGSFGRRLEVDVVAQAVHLARLAEGRPVQLMWSREEDLRQDRCRPAAAVMLQARLGPDGLPQVLAAGCAADVVAPLYRARAAQGRELPPQLAGDAGNEAEAAALVPYRIGLLRLRREDVRSGVAVGYGRGGAEVGRIFALEGFVNELARAARQDPLAYRLALLADRPLHRAVLEKVATASGWGKPLPAGRARGLALGVCRGSIVAQVVEASLGGSGQKVRVHRVVCAVDCGTVINPEIVRQQIEGGVIEALTAALHGGIDIRAGEVQQRNFNDLPLLSLADTPVIETVLIDSERDPAGVGEIALPPLAPALAGAIHALTGRWLRRLPLRLTA